MEIRYMHYYKRNIGDYAKKAGKLTMLQHGAYLLLMDACYDREQFPTKEEALDWSWACTDDEIKAVEFVLKKMFTLKDGVYQQTRIQDELDNYHKNSATNKRIAIERETKRKENNTKRVQTVDESSPNQEPITKKHKPVKDKKDVVPKFNFKKELLAIGVSKETLEDWLIVRKKKKASNTKTAFNGLIKQINKSDLSPEEAIKYATEKSWSGFNASWLDSNNKNEEINFDSLGWSKK